MTSPAAIAVESFSYRYPDGRSALADISFSIAAGESIGLIGPNGAGKTTLFLCLAGVIQSKSGSIRVAGLNPALAADRKKLPAMLGIVFQDADDQLFRSTVAENVAFGPLNLGLSIAQAKERVTESLAVVGLSGFEERVPFQLSGGEKRMAALAGVLAMKPEVLLLDEPTQFLDPRGRKSLIRLLQSLPGTKIIASHDLKMIKETCSKVLLLDEGKLAACGRVEEVLSNQELLEGHGLV